MPGNSDLGEISCHLKLLSFSSTPVMFEFVLDGLVRHSSCSKLNSSITKKSDLATLMLTYN